MLLKTLVATALFATVTANATPFKNFDVVAVNTAIDTYSQVASQRTVKIAILDNGFSGRAQLTNVTYHAGPIAVDAKNEEQHGTYMAQIVQSLLARTPDISYDLHLYSAFGYTNLKTAVEDVTANHFDIVLYSQVWEYGGNGDGRGFINSLVNQATAAGVVWVNASGNFGNATYEAPVEIFPDGWAYLPSPNHGVRIRCLDNAAKKCNLRAVLSWNDFKDQPDVGTDKDLDLVLTDDTMKVLKSGGLQQVLKTPADGNPGTSLYPREIIEAELKPGVYELRVKAQSQNFSKDTDHLRIVTSGDYLEQIDITDRRETLLAPADNATVITVGASDSDHSSSSASMAKPEVTIPSEIFLKTGDTFKGSSNSAAMIAALAVVAKAENAQATREDVLNFLASNGGRVLTPGRAGTQRTAPSAAQTYEELGFAPTGAGCFKGAFLPQVPAALQQITKTGAKVYTVETNAGFKVMVDVDPFTLDLGVQREDKQSMLVVGPNGYQVFSRSVQLLLANGQYEVLQTPSDAVMCSR